jgi:hypothetical protein
MAALRPRAFRTTMAVDGRRTVPIDPLDLERLRHRLVQLDALQRAAAARAAHPPRLTADDWRGPAFAAYALAADRLADDLRAMAGQLAEAEALARTELARGLA